METYSFEFGKKHLTLDFPHAFALGDALFEAGRLEPARSVFEILAKVSNRGPRENHAGAVRSSNEAFLGMFRDS